MNTKTALILLFALIASAFSGVLHAQSVSELEARLRRSTTKGERMNLYYQIAEKVLSTNAGKAAEYATNASDLAVQLGEKRMAADAYYLAGRAHMNRKDYKKASASFSQAWEASRTYGLREIALSSVEKLQDIALRQNNDPREALKWSQEAVRYLKDNSPGRGGVGDAAGRLETQLRTLEAENRNLRGMLERAKLIDSSYRETEARLTQVQEQSMQELSKRDEAITQITQQKIQADSFFQARSRQLEEKFTAAQLADSLVIAQSRQELAVQQQLLAEAELAKQQSENLRNVLALLSAFVFVLAGLFYMRYRAKRRAANDLRAMNEQIASEQKRSDELLLNILPPAIAQELKTRNKVAAQKYEQATVMFIDFIGFTRVAERLSPEQLVEELDFCFSNFDHIIGQYRIEKIKTIGDAYLCASGLSDKNASPSDMIKAALQIQDFLLHLQAERMSQGLPYFEARVGIHTGPVVAGVVGAKKFAYDIWGDTVNIAARFEEVCDPGRVNVSESTYSLAKYEFEWYERGKIAAKNKLPMEMYYVTSLKRY